MVETSAGRGAAVKELELRDVGVKDEVGMKASMMNGCED